MMDVTNVIIKAGSGTYNLLDKKYNKYVKRHFLNGDEDDYERWLTYDYIIKELIDLGELNFFEEIKYRITGGENPNEVFLDIIDRDIEIKNTLTHIINKLKTYQGEDLLKRFST